MKFTLKNIGVIVLCFAVVGLMFFAVSGNLFSLFSPYTPTQSFQVQLIGSFREDLGAHTGFNAKNINVFRDGGATFVETVTSSATGGLTFAEMYWVGETITIQCRDQAPPVTASTDPYLGAPVDYVVPASAEAGDTVTLGTVWGRMADAAATIVLVPTDQNGGQITNTTALFYNTTDTAARVILTTGTASHGWGMEDDVTDLLTGDRYIGSIVVLTSTPVQAITNAKWHVATTTENYYIVQVGRFANDPNVVGDGQSNWCSFIWNAAMTADATVALDAYDCVPYIDMMNGLFTAGETCTVTAINTKIA